MNNNLFSDFNKKFDLGVLREEVKDCETNRKNGDFEEVPDGEYEVSVNRMELRESRNGQPMLSISYRILAGAYQNRLIFANNVLTNGVGLHNANETLRSMGTILSNEIVFEDFVQYGEQIEEVFDLIKKYNLEYIVKVESTVSKQGKTFRNYKIVEVFDDQQ